jgi:exodeoxyribonuclease-5
LCGTNKKRNYLNHYIRSLKGINDTLPIIGDKMVCRKNSWDNYLEQSNLFLVNGLMGEITSQPDQENFTYFDRTLNRSRFDTIFRFDFTPQNTDEFYESLKWDYDSIMDGTNNMDKKNGMGDVGVNICNYGYAITVHVSQGSEYNKVVFFGNELFGDEENRNRLLYTGITRAKEKLILVL